MLYLIKWIPEPGSFFFYSVLEQEVLVMEKGNNFSDRLENTYWISSKDKVSSAASQPFLFDCKLWRSPPECEFLINTSLWELLGCWRTTSCILFFQDHQNSHTKCECPLIIKPVLPQISHPSSDSSFSAELRNGMKIICIVAQLEQWPETLHKEQSLKVQSYTFKQNKVYKYRKFKSSSLVKKEVLMAFHADFFSRKIKFYILNESHNEIHDN